MTIDFNRELEASDYVGLLAAIFLMCIPIPQLWKTIKTKSSGDISLWYIIMQIIANGTFMIYGYMVGDIYLIISNTFLVICNIFLIGLKYIFDGAQKESDNQIS
jgi:MtN3 and saliva related transmembrane protein